MLFPLLLFSFLLGTDATSQVPRVLLTPNVNGVKDKELVKASFEEPQQLQPVLDPSWISMYIPVKSCHRKMRKDYGKFSPPAYLNGFEGNIWCNWTIWAGSKKHIIIYITGFKSDELCDKNEDRIFFHGISSLAENTVVYACWRKEIHAFATYAKGVHIVFLMRYSASSRGGGFAGQYYIFKQQEIGPYSEDATGSGIFAPQPSLLASANIPRLNKETLLLKHDDAHSHVSARNKIDRVTEPNEILQARKKIVTSLKGFAWQTPGTLHRQSDNRSLLSTFLKGSAYSPYSLKSSAKLLEMRGPGIKRISPAEMTLGLIESVMPFSDYSDSSDLKLSTLIKSPSPTEEMEFPSRIINSSLGLCIMNHLWISSKLAQLDCLALAAHSQTMSPDRMVIKGTRNEMTSSQSFKQEGLTGSQRSVLVHETKSREVGLESILLPIPEENGMATKMQENDLFLSLETQQRELIHQLCRTAPVFSDATSASEWEIGIAPILDDEATILLDTGTILKSFVEAANQLKVISAVTLPYNNLKERWHLEPRSSYQEPSRIHTSHDLASRMTHEADKFRSKVKRSCLLDLISKPKSYLIPSKTTAAPLAAELESSHFISVRMASPCPFLADVQELPLSHDTTAALLLAIPGLEATLSPSMTLTYPVTTAGPDQTRSLAVVFQDSIFSVQEPSLLPRTAPDSSSAVGELGLIPSKRMCSYCGTETIELQTISPTATVLEPNQPQRLVINTPVATEIKSTFALISEMSTSVRLQISTVRPEISSKSSCCQHVCSTTKQGDVYQLTTLSSSLTLPKVTIACGNQGMDLEYLSPTAVMPPVKESKEEVLSGTTTGRIIKNIFSSFTDKILNLKSESKLCTLLVRFILNTQSPLNEFVTEMSLIPGPVISNQKKRTVSRTEPTFPSSTSIPILPQHTEEWIPVTLPTSLTLLEEGSGQLSDPQRFKEIQQNAKWQQSSLDFLITDHNVPRPFMETPILKKTLNLSSLQVSSNIENKVPPKVGPVLNHLDLGFPWLLVYLPVKSCHVILKDEAGTFSPPTLSRTETNNWCNWTIWAGPHKHILIYIEGFEGKSNCEENQDRIIFQGILSSTENKVTYACRNHGTLIFATQAVAVYVVFLSEAASQNQSHKHFKGRYYIFKDYVNSTSGEKSVLKSNSSVEFSPKSYVLHSGHSVNSEESSQMLGKENRLPVTNKKTTKPELETFLKPAVGTHMNVSLLKSTKKISLNPFDMKTMQVTKPSIDNRRTLNESPTLVLVSNDLENKEETFTYRPDVFSASPHITQNLRMMTKLEVAKNLGAVTESLNPQNDGHTATDWTTIHMRSTGGEIKNTVTFPQVSLEEQGTPRQSPKSIPPKLQEQMLQMLLSNSGASKKNVDLMESPQHSEQTKIDKGEQMDNQIYRAENGNIAVQITESEGIMASPPKSTMKTKFHQATTLASTDVRHAPSLRSFNDNWMGTFTTVNPQVMSSNCLRRTQINTAFTTQYKKLITKYRERLQKKQTKASPSYSPSGWLPTTSTLLKVKNKSSNGDPLFRSHENYSVLDSQHNPGDLLFEIVFGIEHKGQLPPVGSTLEKAFIGSIKHKVQEKMKLFSNKIKEFKLKEIMRKEETEMDRQNGPSLVFRFWLHLTSEEENISHLLHFQLEDLGGAFVGAGKVQTVLVRDVNECSSGIGLCGNEAICLNGYGTYFCQCKEEYEDRSLTKSGTLCVRNPRSGLGSLYSYTEIIVGITVFFITVLVVVISVLCTIIKKRRIKKDMHFRAAALPGMPAEPQLQPTAFDHNNIRHLLTLDPAQLKVRAKLPEWPLQLRTSPSETYRVSIEQSECL